MFAFKHELDAWRRERMLAPSDVGESNQVGSPLPGTAPISPWMMSRSGVGVRAAVTASVVVLALMATGLTWARARNEGPVLETPAHLEALTPEPGTVILLWTDMSLMEDRFEVSRSGTIAATLPEGSTKAEFTGLDAGVSYHWDVRACNAAAVRGTASLERRRTDWTRTTARPICRPSRPTRPGPPTGFGSHSVPAAMAPTTYTS